MIGLISILSRPNAEDLTTDVHLDGRPGSLRFKAVLGQSGEDACFTDVGVAKENDFESPAGLTCIAGAVSVVFSRRHRDFKAHISIYLLSRTFEGFLQ